MAAMEHQSYRLGELADAAGVSPRTVRYYIAQGLLPSPGRLGAGTRYGTEQLDRLQLIRHLQDQGLSLAEIRDRLEPKATPTLAEAGWPPLEPALAMLPAKNPAPSPPPRPQVARSVWERIALAPGVELNVRRNSISQAQVDRLVAAADNILGSGGSNG